MNREYIMLSDNSSVVIDHNGHATKRESKDNMHDILSAENDVERIENEIKELNECLASDQKFMDNYKKGCEVVPYIFMILISVGLLTGLISFVIALIFFLLVPIFGISIFKEKILEEMNSINFQLDSMNILKEDYAKKLEEVVEKSREYILHEEKINEIIQIEHSDELDKIIDSELDKAYEESIKDKGKKKVLKKQR